MKATARVREVDGNLEGEHIGMTIDQGALAHIMSVLTDLYSDPEMAVIREYSTNAYDAHIESGVKRPIEVTLPTNLAPFFRVHDYGEGLDAEDIREIYSRYGASTKRNSNDVVGMLGLGCKSALTYIDQFTITGIKNGHKIQVSVSRDADGSGSMTIVDECKTNELSGVEIIVPAKRHNAFEEKAIGFFRFWNEGTVLVNGKAPKRISGTWVTKDLLLTEEAEQPMIVMGNVAYPVAAVTDGYDQIHSAYQLRHKHPKLSRHGMRDAYIVAFVDIGKVHFTPSRESLQMTPQTKATIADIEDRSEKEINAAFAKSIAQASSPQEAGELAAKARDLGFKGTPIFKGEEVPLYVRRFKADDMNNRHKGFVVVRRQKYSRDRGWNIEAEISLHRPHETKYVWLTGYKSENFTPFRLAKLMQWMEQKNLDPDKFILVDELPAPEWIDPAIVFPWEEVEVQKINREKVLARKDGRPSGSYEGTIAGHYKSVIEAEDIDTSKPLFYIPKQEVWRETKDIFTVHPDATLITLGGNRIEKFKRDFPLACHVFDYLRQRAQTWKKSLTKEDLIVIYLQHEYDFIDLKLLDPARIDDPQLKKMVNLATQKRPDLLKQAASFFKLVGVLPKPDLTNPLEKYPLTNSLGHGKMNGRFGDHVYLYLNAVYAAEKEQ